jgi:maleate isomerase
VILQGWRARIGFIYPSSGRRDYEFLKLLPDGVTGHFTRVAFGGRGDLRAIGAMSQIGTLMAAAELLAPIGLSCITWADTSGSFMFGLEGARSQAAKLAEAAKAPASSTSLGLLEACRALEIKSLSIASPYLAEVNEALRRFLEEADIDVVKLGQLELPTEHETSFCPPERMRQLAREMGVVGDALFIPCTDTPALELIPSLEFDLHKPVLTSNQVTVWHALRTAGVHARSESGGRLMSGSDR